MHAPVEDGHFSVAELAAPNGHKTMMLLKRYYQAHVAALVQRMKSGQQS